jgi:hypothetical protein
MRMAPGRSQGCALLVAADFEFFGFFRSGTCNGLDTTDEKLIIVYGIQRADVKNCFCEKVSCDPMDLACGGQKPSTCRSYAEDLREPKWCRSINKAAVQRFGGSGLPWRNGIWL